MEEGRVPRPPETDTLAVHIAVATDLRKARRIRASRSTKDIASLDQLPETISLPGPDDPLREKETMAFACQDSLQEPARGRRHGMPSCTRDRRSRYGSYPPQSSSALEGRFVGIE